MADELKLRKDADRAARAQALLDDDILKSAFATLDEELVAAWRNTNDGDRAFNAWLAVRNLANVRRALESIVSNGQLAAAELNQILRNT